MTRTYGPRDPSPGADCELWCDNSSLFRHISLYDGVVVASAPPLQLRMLLAHVWGCQLCRQLYCRCVRAKRCGVLGYCVALRAVAACARCRGAPLARCILPSRWRSRSKHDTVYPVLRTMRESAEGHGYVTLDPLLCLVWKGTYRSEAGAHTGEIAVFTGGPGCKHAVSMHT